MAVMIGEIVSEVVLEERPSAGPPAASGAGAVDDEMVERIVRKATERVLEHLRREWER